jgi:hypothetical protein
MIICRKQGGQNGKIVFVNATQSPNLGRITVFIEEHNLKRDIKKILKSAMEFMDKQDVLPVVVTMEAIHNLHVVSSMLFLLPIRRLNGCSQIDMINIIKISLDNKHDD